MVKNKEFLTNNDLRILSRKLMSLNYYENENLSKTKERLQFWEESVKEYGADTIADELGNRTYADLINNTLKHISLLENEISENNLLIEKIKSVLDYNQNY